MRRGFSLMETLVVVALLGLFAGGTLWTARTALDRRAGAAAAAALARLDRDARRLAETAGHDRLARLVAGEPPWAAAAAGPVVLEWSLSDQEARLWAPAGGDNSPREAVRLPATLELREVWVAGAERNPRRSGAAAVRFGPEPPTYAVELREAGVSRWVLVAGLTGQRTVFDTRRGVEGVIGAL